MRVVAVGAATRAHTIVWPPAPVRTRATVQSMGRPSLGGCEWEGGWLVRGKGGEGEKRCGAARQRRLALCRSFRRPRAVALAPFCLPRQVCATFDVHNGVVAASEPHTVANRRPLTPCRLLQIRRAFLPPTKQLTSSVSPLHQLLLTAHTALAWAV